MGVNPSAIGHLLGISGQPKYAPGVNQLLGPQPVDPDTAYSAPSQDPYATVDNRDIVVSNRNPTAPQAAPVPVNVDGPQGTPLTFQQPAVPNTPMRGMDPAGLGMAQLPETQPIDNSAIALLRRQMLQKDEVARQLYHPKSELGTHGLLRDVVGNVSDIGRRMLGFSPRYHDEKLAERQYGMTSSDPNVAAASYEGARQYDAPASDAYQKQIDAQNSSKELNAANAEYKNSQAQNRYANVVSGLGSSLLAANQGADEATAENNYQRMKPAIQANLDRVYGEGVMKVPDNYDEGFARQLSQAGFTGSNVQRYQSGVLSETNRRQIAQMRDSTQRAIAGASNDTRLKVAQIIANSSANRTQMEIEIRRELGLAPETRTETEGGSIIHPTKTITTTKGGSSDVPSGSPLDPHLGQGGGEPAPKFYNGHWYKRGPNGEAVMVR